MRWSLIFQPKLSLSYRDETVNSNWKSSSSLFNLTFLINVTACFQAESLSNPLTRYTHQLHLFKVLTDMRHPFFPLSVLSVSSIRLTHIWICFHQEQRCYAKSSPSQKSSLHRNRRFFNFDIRLQSKSSIFFCGNHNDCWNGVKNRS